MRQLQVPDDLVEGGSGGEGEGGGALDKEACIRLDEDSSASCSGSPQTLLILRCSWMGPNKPCTKGAQGLQQYRYNASGSYGNISTKALHNL